MNLCSNAIQAMSDGRHLRVGLEITEFMLGECSRTQRSSRALRAPERRGQRMRIDEATLAHLRASSPPRTSCRVRLGLSLVYRDRHRPRGRDR